MEGHDNETVFQPRPGDLAKYVNYLDELRESGKTNMFGATPYLVKEFPELDDRRARMILVHWMKTFSERSES